MSKLVVSSIGPASSVQDGGRHGAQRYGLTPSGAMDRLALASANCLVGNAPFAAAIEIGPFGAVFTARQGAVRVALTGGSRNADISGRSVAPGTSMTLADGETLTLGFARSGTFSYLAIDGGISGEPMFDSLAVNARAGLGSPYPRPLQAGDELQTLPATGALERRIDLPIPADGPIRVVMGPQDDEFSDKARDCFLDGEWKISATSDRMGYRLEGPVIGHLHGHNIVSDGTVNGSIQIPGNGQPIVLMPDRGTSGGYPKIATVITADLGRFAQISAGTGFRFKAVSMAEAQAEARKFAALLRTLPERVRALESFDLDLDALQNANVAGAAVSAVDARTWQIPSTADAPSQDWLTPEEP
jgi:5-oxoprolinase (ATP-hydrolysing) subunit C